MARNFNGSSHITLSPGPIPALQSFSVAAIYRVTTNPGFEAFIMGWDAGGSTAGGLGVSASGNFRAIVASSSWIPASTNISGGASDGWICVALTKVAGTTTLRLHRYLYSSDTWARGDSSLTANNSLAPTQVRLGASASGSSGFIGDLAAAAIFNTTLTDDQVSSLPFSLGSWHSLNPSGMWVLDQSDVTQAVVDWTGRGMNESARTGSTVSTVSVPILGYGHPVIAPTRTAPPPWLNQNSGVAGRNGTNSHTIPFGFTSTSGNMLAVIVYGGVTHAASGWTEQLFPVSSGELSVFTKASAGDSSITVTHNGSDYPVAWVAYEFPAGSTYTAGTGSSPTADTFSALTGLPGTAQLVIAARGRIVGSTAATSASSVWDAPLAEDADLFADHNGSTDGAYLTVGHATGVTSTSITPTATTTIGGTWVVPDRQHVVFAIALGSGGGSTVNGTASVVGAGSVSATGTQVIRVTASITGTGSVTAAATQRGAATVAGAGTVNATGSVRTNATATVTGAGSVTATGSVRTNGTATITGVGTVSAAVSQGAGATVTGTGSVVAGAGGVVNGTASVTGAGSVTAAARTQAGANVTGVGSVAASATQAAGATVTGTGSVSAGAGGVVNGTASVTGSGSVSALATQRGSAAVTGSGSVTAAGQVVRLGTASVIGAGSVAATVRQLAGASVVGVGQVTATSAGQITYGTASVMGQGFVTASSNSRITPRPFAGVISRPNQGVTARP